MVNIKTGQQAAGGGDAQDAHKKADAKMEKGKQKRREKKGRMVSGTRDI